MFSFTWIIWYWDFLCVNFRNGQTCSVCLESRVVTDQTRRGDWTRNPSMNSVKFPFSVYICFEYMIQYYSNNNIYILWNVLKEILTLENWVWQGVQQTLNLSCKQSLKLREGNLFINWRNPFSPFPCALKESRRCCCKTACELELHRRNVCSNTFTFWNESGAPLYKPKKERVSVLLANPKIRKL